MIVQVVESFEAQDKITFGITSKALLDYGWDSKLAGSLKSISAAYLTGFLAAKKIKDGEFIIDIGMALNKKGGRIYAIIAGLIEGGLKIRANEEVLPPKERLMAEHQSEEVQKAIKTVMAKIDSGKEVEQKKPTEKVAKKETKTKKIKE
jgi:large subunit ribosomal protein L18